MAIRFDISPGLCDLPTRLVGLYQDASQPFVVLCRTGAIQTMLGHQLACMEPDIIDEKTSLRLTTFEGWFKDLWHAHGDGRVMIDDAGRRIYLNQALQSDFSEKSALLCSVSGRRMLEALARFYRTSALNAFSSYSIVQDAFAVVGTYHRLMTNQGYIDIGVALEYLTKHVPVLETDIAFYGFRDISHAQGAFMQQIARSREVYLLSAGGRDSLPVRYAGMFAQLLDDEVIPCDTSFKSVSIAITDRQVCTLEVLAAQVYVEADAPLALDTDAISFRTVAGTIAQVVAIVEEVQRMQSQGMGRIAVVLPTLVDNSSSLVRELERKSISYQFDIELALASIDFADTFIALLQLLSGQSDPCIINRFTASPFSGWSKKDAVSLDRRLRETVDSDDRSTLSLLALMRRIQHDAREGKEEGTYSPHAESIVKASYECMDSCLHEAWQRILDGMLAQAYQDAFATAYQREVTLAAYRAISTVLFELMKASGGPVAAVDILAALDGHKVQIAPIHGARDLLLTTPHRIAGLAYDAVILSGVDSKSMRMRNDLSGTDKMLDLLGVGEHVGLSEDGIENTLLLRDQEQGAAMLLCPQKHLSIIFKHADDDGQELQPSGFLEEIVSQFQEPHEGFSSAWQRLTACSQTRIWDSPEVLAALYLDTGTSESYARIPLFLRVVDRIQGIDTTKPLSVSQIEKYAQCPYEWFLQYRVGGRQFDADRSAREIGSEVHELLHEIFARWIAQGEGQITEENVSRVVDHAMDIIDERFAQEERTRSLLPDAELRVRTYVLNVLMSEVILNTRLDSIMRPAFFELSLDDLGIVEIEDVPISGKVDRIDISDESYVITDYKSTQIDGATDMIRKRTIQAGLYVLALEQLIQRRLATIPTQLKGRQGAGALYRSYRSGEAKGIIDKSVVSFNANPNRRPNPLNSDTDHEKYRHELEQIADIAVKALTGLKEGDIGLLPQGDENHHLCTYCPWIRCPHRREGFR